MLFRAVIIFFVFSNFSHARFIIDPTPCIPSFWYTPPFDGEASQDAGVLNIDHSTNEALLSSCRPLPLVTISEASDGRLYVYYGSDSLIRTKKNTDGLVDEFRYPAYPGGSDLVQIVNEIPYVLDLTNNTIWRWDSALESWLDLKSEFDFPAGSLSEYFIVASNHMYISVSDGVDKGVWKLGLNSEKVSEVEWRTTSRLYPTASGMIQVYLNEQSKFEVIWLDSAFPSVELSVDLSQVTSLKVFPLEDAIYIHLFGGDYSKIFYIPNGGGQAVEVNTLADIEVSFGCTWGWPSIMCSAIDDNGNFNIYRLNAGVMELDSDIRDQDFLSIDANEFKIYAKGSNRFIFFNDPARGHVLYSLNNRGLHSVGTPGLYSDSTKFMVLQGVNNRNQLHWLAVESRGVKINTLSLDGDEYIALERAINEPVNNEDDDPVNNEGGDSQGSELNASLNIYLLCISLLLLFSQARNRK